jgi:hypothetical protein
MGSWDCSNVIVLMGFDKISGVALVDFSLNTSGVGEDVNSPTAGVLVIEAFAVVIVTEELIPATAADVVTTEAGVETSTLSVSNTLESTVEESEEGKSTSY